MRVVIFVGLLYCAHEAREFLGARRCYYNMTYKGIIMASWGRVEEYNAQQLDPNAVRKRTRKAGTHNVLEMKLISKRSRPGARGDACEDFNNRAVFSVRVPSPTAFTLGPVFSVNIVTSSLAIKFKV